MRSLAETFFDCRAFGAALTLQFVESFNFAIEAITTLSVVRAAKTI
jgi:hypothetical protein